VPPIEVKVEDAGGSCCGGGHCL